MEQDLYRALKAEIINKLGNKVKTVARFNNQFERSNESGEDNSFIYPAVFIQFTPTKVSALGTGVVQRELVITTHLGVWSTKTDDDEILSLKQDLFNVVHFFQQGNYGKLAIIDERISFDYDNIEVLQTDYKTSGNDFTTDKRALSSFAVTPVFTASTTTLTGLTI